MVIGQAPGSLQPDRELQAEEQADVGPAPAQRGTSA